MTALEKINAYLDSDLEKVAKIIDEYPRTMPTKVFAEMLGCHIDTAKAIIQSNPLLGAVERKPGKVNKGYIIPTAQAVRWYLLIQEVHI